MTLFDLTGRQANAHYQRIQHKQSGVEESIVLPLFCYDFIYYIFPIYKSSPQLVHTLRYRSYFLPRICFSHFSGPLTLMIGLKIFLRF